MESLINITEIIIMITLIFFSISMFLIIRTVSKHNPEIIESAIISRLFLNFDLSVFRKSYIAYYEIKKSKILLALNLITFLITIIGFLFVFIYAVIDMIMSV